MVSIAMRSVLCILFCVMLLNFDRVVANTSTFQADDEETNRTTHVALFVFGDSLFDVGNNDFLNISIDYKANFPPYGKSYFKFPTGRFSDGRLIPDFIAVHANLPLWKPYLAPGPHDFINGANFASAAASVLPENSPDTLNLEIQQSYFKEVASSLKQQLGDAEAKKLIRNAVYFSSFAGVDYWVFEAEYTNASQSMKQDYVNLIVEKIMDWVKEIYEMGGRKFAFQSVAPCGCSPKAKQTENLSENECFEIMLELPKLHNNALVNATKELETQLPEFKYLFFDFYTALLDMTSNPSKYGIKEVDIACCGSGIYRGADCGIGEYDLCSDPTEYLYFDGQHPTEHAYSELADGLWIGGNDSFTTPLSMKQLFELEVNDDEIENFLQHDGVSVDE